MGIWKVQSVLLIKAIIQECFFFNLEDILSQILDPAIAKVAAL